MKLFLLTNTQHKTCDEFDSCVVIAPDEEFARTMRPDMKYVIEPGVGSRFDLVFTTEPEETNYPTWTSPENVAVEYLGETDITLIPRMVCASYNAG